MNGFSKSGKTTLVNKIVQKFPNKFVSVDSSNIHDFLNTNYWVFVDDNTIEGKSYDLRDKATKSLQKALQETLLENHINVIDDSCNSTVEKRAKIIQTAKNIDPDIKTMIISIVITESELLNRLKSYDDANEQKGEQRAWLDLYTKIQKPSFQKPTPDEADYILFYTGKNIDELYSVIQNNVY